jgi:phosphohistidine phosphatase
VRTLLLFRHAKAKPAKPQRDDIDRPLSPTGREATKQIGHWIQEYGIPIDWVICSPASRTRETLSIARYFFDIQQEHIVIDEQLYLASLDRLLTLLAKAPKEPRNLMLVGHNPGMEDLLTYLCGEDLPRTARGKLMPTATLAVITLPKDWHKLKAKQGKLLNLIRPKELDC